MTTMDVDESNGSVVLLEPPATRTRSAAQASDVLHGLGRASQAQLAEPRSAEDRPPLAQSKPSPASHRLPMFDAMRVFAAVAVIFTHTAQQGRPKAIASAAQFGVAFFTVAAMILLARSIARRPTQSYRDYALTRVRRLMVPLVLWSAIYVGFFGLMYRLFGQRDWLNYGIGVDAAWQVGLTMLVGGASIHLWFLPYILLVCIAAFPVLKLLHRRPKLRVAAVVALTIAGAGSALLRADFESLPYNMRVSLLMGLYTMPTFFWGLALAAVYPKQIKGRAALLATIAGAAVFLALCYASWRQVQTPFIRAGKGIAMGMFGLSHWSPYLIQQLATLGQLSFGVYLVHFLVVRVLREAASRVVAVDSLPTVLALTAAAAVISYAIAIVCNRSKLGKVLFP